MSLFRSLRIESLQSLHFGNDAAADNAEILGGGTNTDPLVAGGSKNFLDFRTKTSAASGDLRGIYLRHYLSGGAGGEAARFFTTVESDAAGTAHGGHISLNFGSTTGTLSGLGVAVRGTFHVPNRAITLGTAAALQAEVFFDGTSSNATATKLSLIRALVDGGDATAQNKLTHVMDIQNLGTNVFGTHSSTTILKKFKVNVNGTDYWIPLYNAV